jgi:putative peptide zinc metalloprotease protein
MEGRYPKSSAALSFLGTRVKGDFYLSPSPSREVGCALHSFAGLRGETPCRIPSDNLPTNNQAAINSEITPAPKSSPFANLAFRDRVVSVSAVAHPEPISPAPPPAAQENVVMPPLRKDLVISQQLFEGRTYYVIKDPISLQYFRMTAEDYYLATLFDGVRTFGKIREAYAVRFPHVRLDYTAEELQERVLRFANDLALMQFLSVQGSRLKARFDAQQKQKKKKAGLYQLANQVFFFRFSLFDPDRLFGRMARSIAWIWTKTSLWISIGICLAATLVFILNVDRIHPTMANFFSWKNLGLIWVTTILIKSIHELGHGLTCKHLGAEVHEVGAMALVFTPYFFVNVTDSWTMPNRMHRILVSSAGIYVELVLASFATFLWAIVQPGPFQDFLFNVMVVASVSTLIFNANPLMRFDGYYIMTDLIEVPNLQAKSRALIQHQFTKLLFGHSNDQVLSRMPLPKKRFWLFYIYAVLSWVYGYYVIYSLARFMKPHLAPLGLEGLAEWFTALALISWVALPLIGFFKSMQLTHKDWKPGGRLRRLMAIGGIALGVFAVACFVPVELKITRVGAVQLAEPEEVRPEVPGFVEEVLVKEGDQVKAGQPLARLSSREIEQNLYAVGQRLRATEAQHQRAIGLDHPAEQKQIENLLAQFRAKLSESQRDVAALTLRARQDGAVLTRENTLLTSTPSALHGRLLKPGELFCDIVRLDPMRIKIALNEKQVRYVEQGQRVLLKADAFPGRTFEGKIASKPLMFVGQDMPAAFSARRAGDVPTGFDAHGKEVPLERVFTAEIEVQNPDGVLRPGMTGRARIYAGQRPWGKLVLQSLLDLVSLDYRF